MRVFIAISAVLAVVFGAFMVLAPTAFLAPLKIALTPTITTLAQDNGATLIGLGVVNWLARNSNRTGLIAVLGGNLVVQVLSLAVVIRTMSLGAGTMAAPPAVLHVVLGSFFAYFLVRAWALPKT